MKTLQRPLSPSRLGNTTAAVIVPQLGNAPVRRKPTMHFEPDDDFFFAEAALDEAEMEDQQPPEDLPPSSPTAAPSFSQARPQVASSFTSDKQSMGTAGALVKEDTIVGARPGVKEGKQRMVLEEDDQFGQEDFSIKSTSARAERESTDSRDYAARFGDLSSVNLNLRKDEIPAMPVEATTLDGRKFTLQRKKKIESWKDSREQQKADMLALSKLAGSMLETPYHRMVSDIADATKLAAKQAKADATNAAMDVNMADVAAEAERGLWTDRYRAKRFTDLLGDERVHRSALLWLKEWDQCVFKGAQSNSAAANLKRERRKKRARNGESAGAGGEEAPAENTDPFGRPNEKILLLSGPPGLGKTTLAHVLARQAGYQVHEVNASDDRTGKVVEERIRNALESRALSGAGGMSGNRPTCVVVDEVDGAGGGGESSFVKTLVKLVTEGSVVKKYKGKGKKDRPLLRPIICICNDLYAPVLRPLRPLAKIIRFTPPTNAMLVTRLRKICDEEGLGADSKNLTLLAEVADGDLRSCLNTLQFVKRRSTVVDEAAIRSSVVGLKDTGTSSTQVIDRLFKKPPRKKGGNGSADDKFINRIVRDVQTSGEYEKISQGCFENYLGVKQLTDTWPRINEAGDWLFLYDRLDGRLRSDRDYELLGYVPYTFVPWYKLFSSHTSAQMEFPKADYEAYLRRVAHQEIAQTFTQSMPHALKNLFTGANIVGELLPLLNRIVAPELKPINRQLIKAEDRGSLVKLVHQMLAMGLSFVQDKTEDGQLVYKLEPPIDVFVHFDGKRASDIATSRYAVRHMVAGEIDAELLRRSEGAGVKTTADDILAAYSIKPAAAKPADVKEAVDFFGRAIAAKPLTASQAAAPPPPPKAAQAVYRFHEGFSNAVRVTKKVADFL